MAAGDRIRAWQQARAAGQTPILDALGLGQQRQAQPASVPAPPPQQVTVNRSAGAGGGGGGTQAAQSQTRGDPQVFALQQQLQAAGFDPGPLDGIMGPRTRAAMQAAEAAARQPTTGAMPRPRPQSVAAMDPMAAPLPPPNPTAPGVPGPPIDRRSSPTVAGPAPGYQPAGWLPVPPPIGTPAGREWTTRGRNPGSIGAPDGDPAVAEIYGSTGPTPSPSPAPSQTRTASPDMWQGPQGDAYASAMQRRGRTTLTNNDIPDPATLDLRQMSEFEQAWMAAGRRPEELGPRWQQARYLRQQQMDLEREMVMRQVQQQQDRDAAMYRVQNGTNPRVAPPAPPVNRSIGEGGYLPSEAVALGQLGASTNSYPGVPALGALIPTSAVPPPPGTPAIGGYYLAPQSQPSLGQLMRRTPASQPYYGV